MTKRVRIENADTASYKVLVQVWDKGFEGAADVLVSERTLHNPTDIDEAYLTDTRYIIVKEA